MQEKIPIPKPNLTLYFNLQPNVTHLARLAGLSKPSIYRMAYGATKPHRETVTRFNAALALLLKERISMAKKFSK